MDGDFLKENGKINTMQQLFIKLKLKGVKINENCNCKFTNSIS